MLYSRPWQSLALALDAVPPVAKIAAPHAAVSMVVNGLHDGKSVPVSRTYYRQCYQRVGIVQVHDVRSVLGDEPVDVRDGPRGVQWLDRDGHSARQ
jgi:hypothetical protein